MVARMKRRKHRKHREHGLSRNSVKWLLIAGGIVALAVVIYWQLAE
jgi:hypothetical protein